jgi:hypothetical protein
MFWIPNACDEKASLESDETAWEEETGQMT